MILLNGVTLCLAPRMINTTPSGPLNVTWQPYSKFIEMLRDNKILENESYPRINGLNLTLPKVPQPSSAQPKPTILGGTCSKLFKTFPKGKRDRADPWPLFYSSMPCGVQSFVTLRSKIFRSAKALANQQLPPVVPFGHKLPIYNNLQHAFLEIFKAFTK